jgi:hypothetical protein
MAIFIAGKLALESPLTSVQSDRYTERRTHRGRDRRRPADGELLGTIRAERGEDMIQGSCCCGEVRFEVSEKPKFVAACHCSRCRKVGATPFAMVEGAGFRLLSGREHVVEYPPPSHPSSTGGASAGSAVRRSVR